MKRNELTNSKNTETDRSSLPRVFYLFFGGWLEAWNDLQNGLIKPFQNLTNTTRPLVVMLLSIVITWFIYVPIHELLHVAGCVITGGTVSELVMGREYGADFLQNIFPFIKPATTQYAGRVTGFEPNGDFGYLVTVFAPFILTLFPGVYLLMKAYKEQKFVLMGPGVVIGLASFYNLTGDFFEIGTIISTRIVNLLSGGSPGEQFTGFWALRSDDIFRLFGEIFEAPALYGLNTGLGKTVTALVIVIGFFLAVSCAGWTYQIGKKLSPQKM